MKRKFTFLITAALMLLTMISQPTKLWGQVKSSTYSLTPNQASTGSSATTYITTLTEFTYNNVSWKMNYWNPKTLQIKTNQSSAADEFRFYNTSAIPGRITQVVISFSALTVSDASKLMFLGGSSEVSTTTGGTAGTWNSTAKTLTWTPGANDNFTYFAFYQNGKAASGTNYLASSDAIVVTYTPTHTLTYSATNGNITGLLYNTSTAVASGASVVEGGKVTLTAEPAGGYQFESWSVEGTGATLSSTTTNPTTFTMGTANATVTANFVAAGGNYITVTPATATPNCAAQYVDFSIDTDQSLNDDPTVFYTTSEGTSSTTAPDWIDGALYYDGTLTVSVKQNKTSSARTAYFRVESATVQSDVITITQAAFTLPAPSFDPESGAVFLNEDVVLLESDTTGATIYYTMGATPADPTTSSLVYDPEEGIVVNESTTIKAIAVKYNISSAVATASYTVVTPLTTMDQIFSAATTAGSTATSKYVTLGNWVVSGVSTDEKTAYVTDGSGKGFITYYGSKPGFAVGNVLSNTVQASLKLYNGAAEFTNLTTGTSGIGVTTGGTVSAITNKTIADLSGVCTGGVYTLSGLTYNSSTKLLSDGVNTIKPYNQLYSDMSFENGETYNVTGVYLQYNDTKEILPRSSADIVEAPGVTASVTSISDFTYNVGGGPDVKEFNVSGANLTDDLTVTASANYKVCKTSDGTYASSVSYEPTTGTVASTTVYIRLEAGLSSDTYEGTVTVASTGAVSKEIALTGTVKHTIAISGSITNGSVESDPSEAAVAGATVTLTATPDANYKLGSFTVTKADSGTVDVTPTGANTGTFTMPADNVTVSATFTQAYAVTYAANGGSGTMTDPNSPYVAETQVTLLANTFTYAGHTWSSWLVKNVSTDETITPDGEGKFTMPSSAVTVTAQWTVNTHDITMPAADTYGEYTTASTTDVPFGTEVTLTYTPASGYEHYVAVWSVNGTPIDGNTFDMPDEDVTVTVAPHPTWTVIYNANGGTGSMSDPNSPYDNGANVTVLANGFTYVGHTFTKWNTQADGEGTDYLPGATINGISANVTLYAQWESGSHVTYTVTSTSAVSATGAIPAGSSATYSSTYGTIYQLTNNNSMTLTLKGFAGQIIKKITLSMHSNGSGGSGNMNMNIGETSYASISSAKFSDESWNGEYTTDWVNIERNASPNNHVVEAGEDIVITIAATANSLFCRSFTIDYETSSDPMVMVSPTVQTVNHEAQSITTGDKIFNLYSLNIDSPTLELAYCDEDGNILDSNPYSSWFTPAVTDNNKVTYSVTANTGGDRTAYFKVYATVVGNPVYSGLCSVTQKHQPHTYTLVDGTNVTLKAGKHYIIANTKTVGSGVVMDAYGSNIRSTKSVTISSKTVEANTVYYITEPDGGIYEFVLSGDDSNKWTIYDDRQTTNKYLNASGGTSNNYLTLTDEIVNTSQWGISFGSGGLVSIVANFTGSNARNILSYNYNNGNDRFSCYKTVQTAGLYLFVRDGDTDLEFHSPTTLASATIAATETYTVESGQVLTVGALTNQGTASNLIIEDGGQLITNNTVQATLKKTITGYGDDDAVMTGWYTIASPVNYTPAGDMLDNKYDLYLYDEANAKWRNYEQEGSTYYQFDMNQNQGYLYANSKNTTLSFAGSMIASNTSNVTVPLSYASTNDALKGINLVGNPFTRNLTSSDVIKIGNNNFGAYYIADGTAEGGENVIACNISSREIKPGEGFIVQASAAENLVFNYVSAKGEKAAKPSFICIEAGNEDFMDRAYVQVGQFNTLSKMSLNEETPQVFVMDNGKNFAATSIETAEGEIPVGFKASRNGQHTLTVSTKGLDVDYLHLIDNMTGADVDLLQTPSYSFTSKTTDYASRFRLVFSANSVNDDSTSSETFAFINGEEIVITNAEADATLQVVDMTGRILVNTKGANRLSTAGMTQGVYVIRMVNGEKVKTQKIVVR